MKKTNVAISIAVTDPGSVWSSGLNQNLAFLGQLEPFTQRRAHVACQLDGNAGLVPASEPLERISFLRRRRADDGEQHLEIDFVTLARIDRQIDLLDPGSGVSQVGDIGFQRLRVRGIHPVDRLAERLHEAHEHIAALLQRVGIGGIHPDGLALEARHIVSAGEDADAAVVEHVEAERRRNAEWAPMGELRERCIPLAVSGTDAGTRESLALPASTLERVADGAFALYPGGIAGRVQGRVGFGGAQLRLITDPGFKVRCHVSHRGEDGKVEQMTKDALAEGRHFQEVMNEGLIAGMSVVGEDFKHNILYVPEVLIAARAMKAGMAVLKPLLSAKDSAVERVGTLLMGTVRGDLHDIGKNLVCMMAEGAGFEVVDIGVDQSVEKFMAAADKCQPTIIGMSALLTTTMTYMKQVIDGFEAAGRGHIKMAIGGAPISQMFADEIGADGYGQNASAAVDLFLRLARDADAAA